MVQRSRVLAGMLAAVFATATLPIAGWRIPLAPWNALLRVTAICLRLRLRRNLVISAVRPGINGQFPARLSSCIL